MSRLVSKDEYRPPLGSSSSKSLITPSNLASNYPINLITPNTPLVSPCPRMTSRPTTAEILRKDFPRLETNPLLKTNNRYTVLSHNTSLISSKPIPSSSSESIDKFIDKQKDLFVLTLEKGWVKENPKDLASKLLPP